jgi:hypothetical protein
MNDDEHQTPSKSDRQQFCHVCAHPLAEGIETCPECDSTVVNIGEILETAKGDESAEAKKAKKKLAIALAIDTWSVTLIRILILGSLPLIYHVLSLSNEEWIRVLAIWPWLTGYAIAVGLAYIILSRVEIRIGKFYLEKEKALTHSYSDPESH